MVRAVSTGAVAPSNPPDITGFDAQVIGAQCHLQWDLASASGLSHYVVKFQPVLTGGLWSKAVTLLARVPINAAGATVPAMNGTYFVKAVNVFDFESRNAALVVTNVALLNALNVVATVGEGPEYDGALTDLVRTPDGLMLSGGSNVDLWPDFDAIDNVDQGQVDAAVALEVQYEGISLLYLGAV